MGDRLVSCSRTACWLGAIGSGYVTTPSTASVFEMAFFCMVAFKALVQIMDVGGTD
jgi:hypothetical protein